MIMEDIIITQEKYIKFLETEIEKYAVIRHYECTEDIYTQGEILRNDIISARRNYETNI